MPITKSLIATEAVRAALNKRDEVTVTVVALPYGASRPEREVNLNLNLNLKQVAIVVDHPPGDPQPSEPAKNSP